MIYAILEIDPSAVDDDRRVKIVYTNGDGESLAARLTSLQTGNPRTLEVIGTCAGGVTAERHLHQRFAHLSIRGEWFWYRGDLVAAIES